MELIEFGTDLTSINITNRFRAKLHDKIAVTGTGVIE